jgi:hypothetical protein
MKRKYMARNILPIWQCGGLLFLLLIFVASGGPVKAEMQSMPMQIREWQADGKDQVFDRETIFKYIDGGAELYLAYDFRQVFCRKYNGPGNSAIVLDVYDMGTAADAFGIFTSEREDEDAHIGQGSEFGGGLLRFWKGRYFVSILNDGGDANADQAVIELGKAVDQALVASGPEPDLLKCLPQPNLDKKKIRYFHQSLLLDKHYFVANENILNLGSKSDCVLAEYPLSKEDLLVLLLVRYENRTQARAAYDHFIRIYMPEAKAGLAQMENKKWTMAWRDRNLVSIVFEAPDQQKAIDLQKAIKK